MTALNICLACAVTLVVSALGAMVFARRRRTALWVASFGSLVACIAGAAASAQCLHRGAKESLSIAWTLPMGAFHVGLDAVSAFFLVMLFVIAGLTSLYAAGYSLTHEKASGPALEPGWTNLMMASMVMIVVARDAALFLMAWEIMSIASFFLVATEDERQDVRHASYVYLVASHLGTVFIFLLFAWLYRNTGTLDIESWTAQRGALTGFSGVAFVFALAGFGTKAGIWPLHVWLPFAHPAAPSPVSALMSSVMIKMGVYGIVRAVLFLGPASPWWGTLLIAVGVVTGLAGVLLALAQNDYKRLLAYSSIENIGIIVLGLGIGLLALSHGEPTVAWFGFAGALLHVLNHALFKGLLFQAAGCVLLRTGQRNANSLGGLAKRMPVTSALFLTAAVAICGIPPLNGFVGEWFIYVGAFYGGSLPWVGTAVLSIIGLVALALMGGLALACFVKAHGVVFLGQPRSRAGEEAREVGPLLIAPMVTLASLCIVIGVCPLLVLPLVAPAVRELVGGATVPAAAFDMLGALSRISLVVAGAVMALALLRTALLRRNRVSRAPTWGCAYPAPTARMQYSAGSFAAPVLATFRRFLALRETTQIVGSEFPTRGSLAIASSDLAAEQAVFPITRILQRLASKLRVLQQGRIQLYLVYLFATLIVVLFWQLMAGR